MTNSTGEKKFNEWNEYKKKLNSPKNFPDFHNREVWWCSIGVNIDCEEDGKNEHYERPVLILQKLAKNKFYGIPLSTQPQRFENYYYKFIWRNKKAYALLDQMRVFSTNRLQLKYGDSKIKINHYLNIKSKLAIILGLKKNLILSPRDERPKKRDFRPNPLLIIITILASLSSLIYSVILRGNML